MRKELAALAVLFFLAHLLHLPPTLEDVDSVNFALGVRDFDVARHQPHPPGYPVFIALGKLSTAALQAARVPNAPPRALGLLSVAAAAALIPLLFALYRRLDDDVPVAWWGMAVAVCSPLFWFTALRPLSDMAGLACAVGAQVCLLSAIRQPGLAPARLLFAGGLLCGIAAGVRVQTVMLTIPVLLAVLVWPGTRLSMRDRAVAAAAAAFGVVAWAIPLLLASGGPGGYLAALGTQAGEDFSGVVMLWTTRQARVAAHALLNSFVWPWRDFNFGIGVLVLAALGFVRLAWKSPRGLLLLLIAFAPYAVFHLLFHETATVRYALPLVLPVAFLAAFAAGGLGRIGLTLTAASVIVASLVQGVPAARTYARDGSPAFRLFEQMALTGLGSRSPGAPDGDAGRDRPAGTVIGMHAVMRRVEEWHHEEHGARVLIAPHGREWLALVEHWRAEPDVPVLFAADPRRTDLALLEPHARTLEGSRRWTFPEIPFVAGTRPGAADAYTMRPPGWMLDRGWGLTAEVAGVTARDALGPHVQPSVAWIRARPGSAELIIGGRHLGPAGSPPARLSVAGDRQPVESWDVAPGFFFRRIALAPGSLAGTGYVPLRVSAAAAGGSRPAVIALEQFDVQSEGLVMFGYLDGWQEPEYNPETARSWRWMSERARIWVRPVGRDVVLTITGESPLTYFDRAPKVQVTAAGVELAQFSPVADFTQQVILPAKALAMSGGLLAIESELWFTPAERGGSQDQRHLALRIYSIAVK